MTMAAEPAAISFMNRQYDLNRTLPQSGFGLHAQHQGMNKPTPSDLVLPRAELAAVELVVPAKALYAR
jgi:hypothetical protein